MATGRIGAPVAPRSLMQAPKKANSKSLSAGELVELGHFQERHPSFGEQVGMHREEIEPGAARRLLKGEVVGPDHDGAVLGEDIPRPPG